MNPLKECFMDAPHHGHTDPHLALAASCGSGALGHHQRHCSSCGHTGWVPNACRSRACPFCRNRERAEWARLTEAALPTVPYFHAVFTVPDDLRALARLGAKEFYGVLLTSVKEALLNVCADPTHLGVTPAMFAVVHTWTQRLTLHPHVHVVISAGGLTPDDEWKWSGSGRKDSFLVPKGVLRAHFQTRLINNLLLKYTKQGPDGPWSDRWTSASAFKHFLLGTRTKKWKLHLERPLAGPAAVVRYLAGYINRVAIAPSRVTDYDGSHVTFTWKDRNNGNSPRTERLPAPTFLARYRQHIPPPRFVRVRFWGLMANRRRADHQVRVTAALKTATPPPSGLARPYRRNAGLEPRSASAPAKGMTCPDCGAVGSYIYGGSHHYFRDLFAENDDEGNNSHVTSESPAPPDPSGPCIGPPTPGHSSEANGC